MLAEGVGNGNVEKKMYSLLFNSSTLILPHILYVWYRKKLQKLYTGDQNLYDANVTALTFVKGIPKCKTLKNIISSSVHWFIFFRTWKNTSSVFFSGSSNSLLLLLLYWKKFLAFKYHCLEYKYVIVLYLQFL